ncbi:MAG: hypothetical protein ACYDAZ_02370 [Thermoplasmataceae archaeon]
MKRIVISIALASIMIFSTLGLASMNANGQPGAHQTLSIETVDSNGNPVNNVTVQGIMQLPPAVYNGTVTVFLGATDASGFYTVNNTTYVHRVASAWIHYKQYHSDAFSPFIIVFLTYNSGNSTYAQQTSIKLTPGAIMRGESYHALAHLIKNQKHELVPNHNVKNPGKTTPASSSFSPETLGSGINNPLPSKFADTSIGLVQEVWEQTNSTTVTAQNGSPLEIPLSQVLVGGAGAGEALETMSATSTDETGSILNPFNTSNVQTTTGAQNGQNSGSYVIQSGSSTVTGSSGGSWAWEYILGYLTVANYELYAVRDGIIVGSLGEYQTLIGITQIETSGSSILGDNAYSQPYFYNEEESYNSLHEIPNGGMGMTTSTLYDSVTKTSYSGWKLTTTDVANTETNYGELAGIAIGVGAIVIAALAWELDVATVVAGIVMSALGISVTVIQWGSSSSDSIFSTVEYASTDSYAPNFYIGYTNAPLVLNGNQVNVPTLFAYVYATPTTSTGGGGCVLNEDPLL